MWWSKTFSTKPVHLANERHQQQSWWLNKIIFLVFISSHLHIIWRGSKIITRQLTNVLCLLLGKGLQTIRPRFKHLLGGLIGEPCLHKESRRLKETGYWRRKTKVDDKNFKGQKDGESTRQSHARMTRLGRLGSVPQKAHFSWLPTMCKDSIFFLEWRWYKSSYEKNGKWLNSNRNDSGCRYTMKVRNSFWKDGK